ncbi:MAG: nitroreductase family protein [Victivallaceae bacterium]|jgi:nitroreductase
MKKQLLLAAVMVLFTAACFADNGAAIAAVPPKEIKLPSPDMKGGKPLMECLALRKTSREFSDKELSPQQLSNLLWAAFGINRLDGRRTAPTAMNVQDPLIYVAMKDGLYLYEPKGYVLQLVLAKDIRAECGEQEFHKTVPLDLIYVSDTKKFNGDKPQNINLAWNHIGFISQNVYLFCASEGLSTVVCGWVNYPQLEKVMGLPGGFKVILTQPVGFPK